MFLIFRSLNLTFDHAYHIIICGKIKGKGFAVVADQVTVLAEQSANAAKESAALIESSVKAENRMVTNLLEMSISLLLIIVIGYD